MFECLHFFLVLFSPVKNERWSAAPQLCRFLLSFVSFVILSFFSAFKDSTIVVYYNTVQFRRLRAEFAWLRVLYSQLTEDKYFGVPDGVWFF